ncbi:MAG: ATP-dependent DNA helicase RecG [Clostridia bacterium]|nr:ATP-dependent DNA helicase RecG [Clostridia bacterium]
MAVSKAESALTPDSPLTVLSGISRARAAAFARMGIHTLNALCHHYPRTYENRGAVSTVSDAVHGTTVSLVLTVGTQPKVTTIRRGMVLTRFSAFDETGSCVITYFNQPYLKDAFVLGSSYRFFGKCERTPGGRLQMTSPRHELLPLSDPGDASTLPSLYPIYKSTSSLTQKIISSAIAQALPIVYPMQKDAEDALPQEICHTYGLCTSLYAIYNIHRPENEIALAAAEKRLAFEELMLFSLGLRLRKSMRRQHIGPPMQPVDMSAFTSALPYALTDAQKRTVAECEKDMTSQGAPMNRLLSGDVGSGKTVCAAAALYIAAKNGYQAAMMAPTEILATQHYQDLAPMFAAFGIECALLVGSTRPKEKIQIKQRLADGSLPLVIGTHALLEQDVVFRSCGLVITDEQHRFGVGQRAMLASKASHVHTLIMSATPIPRTMALMLFGDMDMSVLDTMPPGRQKVSTFAVDESYRTRLNGFIRKQVEEGHQVYIVCPAIEEAEEHGEDTVGDTDVLLPQRPKTKAAVDYANTLASEVFSDLRVGFLHGKMKPAEKEAVMHAFAAGHTQILVSTTVIEVGVNVPNATLMVVENAEYFGLSQLHQLRGRVGRGAHKSYCVLVSDSKTENARERLSIMCSTSNGYEIADRDLKMRGPGDFFSGVGTEAGTADYRQSGEIRFTAASLCDDLALVKNAFAAADTVITGDPLLTSTENAPLRAALERSFGKIIL